MKRTVILYCLAMLLAITGCASTAHDRAGSLEKISIPSVLLGKEITSYVYLPFGYDDTKEYPALYYMASAGGSAYTVIHQFEIAETADRLMASGEIDPMIIIALGIDFSFGINSSENDGNQNL